nr:lipid-A-disaccharide synthase [Paracoccus aestuariivivens]
MIAGEPSGDNLGGPLMAGLKSLDQEAGFIGVGGPSMAAQGLDSLFPMEELSVMGLVEVLPKYRQLNARISQTALAIAEAQPDVLITIDSPDFCLRVAREARALMSSLRTIHYVAPSVWAWRSGRAQKMAKVIDHVLAILPFEPPYMQAAGMTCDFVGHPIAAEPVASAADGRAFREAHEIAPDAPLILCLPGSRRGEVARLGPRFDEALMQLRDRVPEIRVVIPTVRGVANLVRDMTKRWPTAPVVVESPEERSAAFAAANLALAASGTVSLDLAANDVPMVIGYDVAPISRAIIGFLLKTDTVTLVNLVSETRVVPEFLGRKCQAGPMSKALYELIENQAAQAAQHEAMALTMQRLGRGGEAPGLRAARSVMNVLSSERQPR